MLVLAFSLRNAQGIVTIVCPVTRTRDDHRTPVVRRTLIITSADHAAMEATVATLRTELAEFAASPEDSAFRHVDLTDEFRRPDAPTDEVTFPIAALIAAARKIGELDPVKLFG